MSCTINNIFESSKFQKKKSIEKVTEIIKITNIGYIIRISEKTFDFFWEKIGKISVNSF